MATQFSIDDAFVLEGEEEGTVSDGEAEGWKSRDKDREGEMTFGTLSFSKPQTHQSPAATGCVEHSNLKYQVPISPSNLNPCTLKTEILVSFRILKMKMFWVAMAIHLSTTSSKSSGSIRYSNIGSLPPLLIIRV